MGGMELEVQVAVNFVTGYLYNKLPRRRVELLGEGLVRNLTKKFEGHWYPDKPSKGCGYRCLLISHSLDPVLMTSAEESGLSVKDVQSNLPEKLSLWIDPFEVSYRIGEQGPVKIIYKEEQTSMKRNEICDETARWVSLLNGFNSNKTSPVPFEKSGRSSPQSIPSPTQSPSFSKNIGYPYSTWSRAEEPQHSKSFRLSANAKEFVVKPSKPARGRSPVHQNSWNPTAPEPFRGSPSFLNSPTIFDSWLSFNDFNYKDGGFGAAQLPIMA